MNQGGTADSVVLYIFVHDSSLTDSLFCQGRFLFSKSLTQNKSQRSFTILRGGEYYVINQTMASNGGAEVTEQIKDT